MATLPATSVSASQASASSERQSAAAASASASVPSSSRWIFTHEQLMNVPSIREGMSPEEELKRRRVAANTIHQMADRLNHESRVRISQLCICAAMMHMHRFFVFHSFFKFDPRDIAAACLFLAGKSEECPRKLDHVVRIWWAIKFPHSPNVDANRLHETSQLIVTLENLVLQTIVDIPHPYVLTHMQKFARDASGNRRISEIAYWFASDMLHMTNWGVRYTAKAIACVCIQMACLWAEFEIQTTADEAPWYKQVDPTMTLDKLLKLTEEFSHIYKTHGELLNIKKYAMRSSLREVSTPQNPNQLQQQQQQQQLQQQRPGQNQVSSPVVALPPPPVAPQLNPTGFNVKPAEPTRRIDLNDYKLRNSAAQQQQPSIAQNSAPQTQRRNFMRPDVPPQTASKELELPLPPIIANEKQQNQGKPEQVVSKSSENSKVSHLSISGTSKPTSSQKPSLNALKLSQVTVPQAVNEQERHKRSRPDDFEKEAKQRRIENMGTEGSNHRKRSHENSLALISSDSTPTVPSTLTSNVAQTPKSETARAAERHNSIALVNHTNSGSSVVSKQREISPRSLRREGSNGSDNRSRDGSTPRQRDESLTPKRSLRQSAPLNALLPTPPSNTSSVLTGGSQNSKYNSSTMQPNRTANYSGESVHRAAATGWSMTNDYYGGAASNNVNRSSQPSSSHRHYTLTSVGRTKAREPLLSTPDVGNYYRRSRPRPLSPNVPASNNNYRQSQRPSSPGSRLISSCSNSRRYLFGRRLRVRREQSRRLSGRYRRRGWRRYPTRSSTRILSALPPPPPPPPNEELEDGEVL